MIEVALPWILLAKLSGCGWDDHEADEGGLAGSFAWRACEPVADAAKVYGSRREHMLQVGFSQPYVARPAQVQGAGARIASSELLLDGGLLPHLICSPPVWSGGSEHGADQHGDA